MNVAIVFHEFQCTNDVTGIQRTAVRWCYDPDYLVKQATAKGQIFDLIQSTGLFTWQDRKSGKYLKGLRGI